MTTGTQRGRVEQRASARWHADGAGETPPARWFAQSGFLSACMLVALTGGCGGGGAGPGAPSGRDAAGGDLAVVAPDGGTSAADAFAADGGGTAPGDGAAGAIDGMVTNIDAAVTDVAPDLATDASQGTADAPAADARASDAPVPAPDGAGADTAADAASGTPDARPATDALVTDGMTRDAVIAPDATAADAGAATDAATDAAVAPFRVLLFSRTAGFRHASIPNALAALMDLQAMGGYVAEATEAPTAFTAANLARFQVVVFALTSGDALNAAQQTAFEEWIAAGGGYVGIHSASDTEYDWEFYGNLVGAYFSVHPAIQMATVRVEAPTHPVMAGVPVTWARRDEWYNFATNPRPRVTVLATLDETTYTGGTMGADHPIAWVHTTAGGGRAFYTALGHTPESYAEIPFRRHLVNALRWVAKR